MQTIEKSEISENHLDEFGALSNSLSKHDSCGPNRQFIVHDKIYIIHSDAVRQRSDREWNRYLILAGFKLKHKSYKERSSVAPRCAINSKNRLPTVGISAPDGQRSRGTGLGARGSLSALACCSMCLATARLIGQTRKQ